MMGVFLGLCAAFCWGTSDFCAATVARRIGALRAILWTQSAGLLAIAALLFWQGKLPAASPRVLVIMLGIGLAQALAVGLFYRSFEIGKLSLVAPITSGFAVVTALLALLSGERPGLLALMGALLLVLGVLLVTSHHHGDKQAESSLRGVPEAIVAAFFYGAIFWALDFVVPTLGAVWPLAALRVITLIGVGGVVLFGHFRKSAVTPTAPDGLQGLFWPIIAVAAADTGAWLSFNTGTQRADVSIVTALSSLYSAVAIFYGCVIWRERLTRVQWQGVGLILIGVLFVSVK
jgi:drug/metabolite transporter (DMT)-like permease